MKLQQHLTALKKVLHVLNVELIHWKSAKELNLVEIYKQNGLPPTGIVASKLCDYLVEIGWINMSKEGRYIRYTRIITNTRNIENIAESFISVLESDIPVKIPIVERELNVKDAVYVLHNNSIHEGVIIEISKKLSSTLYKIVDIEALTVDIIYRVFLSNGSTNVYDKVYTTKDALLQSIDTVKF